MGDGTWQAPSGQDSDAFAALVNSLEYHITEHAESQGIQEPASLWYTSIMVRDQGRYDHVTSVPFPTLKSAMRVYCELASMTLGAGDTSGLMTEAIVPLAHTVGRALAYLDHDAEENDEYMNQIITRGGESLILGRLLFTISRY